MHCRLSLEPFSEFIDEELKPEPAPGWKHEDCFVITDSASETGYYVIATRTPDLGPAFCLKFTNPLLANQSVLVSLAAGPEEAVRRAETMGFLKFEPPKSSPRAALRKEREAREQEQFQQIGILRPGDQGRGR